MSNDHLMVGTNFDSNMFGYEADPLKLIIDISNELKTLGQPVKLLKYKDLDTLESEVRKIIAHN